MTDVSIIIPFYRRHANLEKALTALARQRDVSFEVVIATPECDNELERLCAPCSSVRIEAYAAGAWNVSQCRNAGIRAARGDVLLFLDADMIARPELAALHRDAHRAAAAPILAAGCALGFAPYEAPDDTPSLEPDPRWALAGDAPLPWALCWSGNLSILRAHTPFFDETFRGWGVEDLEFSYRAVRSGCEVQFLREATAVHQPHKRVVGNLVEDERANFRRFIRMHPALEVEIVVWLNDLDANRHYRGIVGAIANAGGTACAAVSSDALRLGADALGDNETPLPILGVVTPFEDRTFRHVETAGWMSTLPADVRGAIAREVARVGGRT